MTQQPLDIPPYAVVHRFMHESGFDVPHPDEPTFPASKYMKLASRLIQYGADQELEACCKWLKRFDYDEHGVYLALNLRAARRPKPPSLKEQALIEFDSLLGDSEDVGATIIRRALEQLPDDK
jgi:hypothetical protein